MKNDLGYVLQSTRSKKNMSLRDFGDYLGISHTYLDKLEKGVDKRTGKNVSPTIETLSNIANNLNISLLDFMWECGYFEDCNNNQNIFNNKNKILDLEKFIKDLENKIANSDNVVYKNIDLKDCESQFIVDFLQIFLKFILKSKNIDEK